MYLLKNYTVCLNKKRTHNNGSCCTTQKKREKGVENKAGMC
jgi:hypothetical protein